MDNWKKARLIGWLIASSVAILVFCLVLFLRKIYTLTGFCDAFFFAAAMEFALLLIYWIERTGVFDVFNFQFYRFFESFRPDGLKKWDTAYDYKQEKEGKRKITRLYFWPYLIIGGVFLLVAIILLVIVEVMVAR